MTRLSMPVSDYMSSPVVSVHPQDDLDVALSALGAHGISALAVVGAEERLLGVVTRTDLLRVGRRRAGERPGSSVLTLPKQTVREVMEPEVISVESEHTVADAARLMVEHRVHRVFVVDRDRLIGVTSTKDVTRALADQRVTTPIRQLMTDAVITVAFDDPVSLALERLEKAHISGLVVVEDDWPIGVFTQVEALESKDVARDTRMEDVLSPAMLCLDVGTPLHRAAAHAAAMDVRRIIVVHNRQVEGILSGIDFARAAMA
jgi:predicted transcriptional regulator